MARIAGRTRSSPNRRTFEVIINYSAQTFSTTSMIRGDAVYWERVEISPLVSVGKASTASEANSSGTKTRCIVCKGGTQGVVTGRVRSLPSKPGQVFFLAKNHGSTVTSAQVRSDIRIMHPCWGL